MSDHLPFDLPPDGHYARGSLGASVNGFLDTLQQSGYAGANHQVVRDQADLPDPSGGTITLDGSTVYAPKGIVTLDTPLELPSPAAPLVGRHASVDGFLYTGGGTLLQGGGPFMASGCYFHAPGGTMFGLDATTDTEMLVESCAFSDAAGQGAMASLGTITGYRVPTLKGVNVEDFDAGLTFDGSPDKVAIFDSPFRTVDAAGVDVLTLAGSLDTDIVQLKGCYVKSVQSDTTVINAEAGSLPGEVFQYIDTTHDATVTEANILTGDVGIDSVGTKVSNSFPLADSTVFGELDLDASTTVTGSGSGPSEVTAASTLANAARMSQPEGSHLQYDARFDSTVYAIANPAVSGANTAFSAGIALNGSELERSRSLGFASNSNDATSVTATARVELTAGDVLSVTIENVGGTGDLNVDSMTLTV